MSNIVLRVDIFKSMVKFVDITKFFSQVSFFCNDPILLGYPYGLIDADKFARISNDETDYLKNIFLANYNKKSIDLHNLLDKIEY